MTTKEMTFDLETKKRWIAKLQNCSHVTTSLPNIKKATEETGLPDWIIPLACQITPDCEEAKRRSFLVELCKAIPVDTDISELKHELAVLRLRPLAKKFPEVSEVINQVINYHENKERTEEELKVVRSIAQAAKGRADAKEPNVSARSYVFWSAEYSAVDSAVSSLLLFKPFASSWSFQALVDSITASIDHDKAFVSEQAKHAIGVCIVQERDNLLSLLKKY